MAGAKKIILKKSWQFLKAILNRARERETQTYAKKIKKILTYIEKYVKYLDIETQSQLH